MSIPGIPNRGEALKIKIMLELLEREKKMLEGNASHFHTDESLAMAEGIVANPNKDVGTFHLIIHYLKEEGMINVETIVHVSHSKGITQIPSVITLTPKGRDWARKIIGSTNR